MKKTGKMKIGLLLGCLILVHIGCKSPAPAVAPEPEPEPKPASVEPTALKLSVSYEPRYFSPDGDGEDDELYITLGVENGDAASWTFDIMQNGKIFKRFEGKGNPTEKIVWDGLSDQPSNGEESALVESATEYPYVFAATDANGKAGTPARGVITVDILIVKEADGSLRIRVPSIIFRANAADFEDLPEEIVLSNERIMRRVSDSLSKFAEYKILVEGHANPVRAPGTKAREAELKKESQPGSLSEKRAEAVLEILAAAGIERSRLSIRGMGITKPIVKFEDYDNWRKNRRVEFYLIKEDKEKE